MSFWTQEYRFHDFHDNNKIKHIYNNLLDEFYELLHLNIARIANNNKYNNFSIHLKSHSIGNELFRHNAPEMFLLHWNNPQYKNFQDSMNTLLNGCSFLVDSLSNILKKPLDIKITLKSDEVADFINRYKNPFHLKIIENQTPYNMIDSFYNSHKKLKISLFCNLVSKYGIDTSIKILRSAENDIISENIQPVSKFHIIKNDEVYKMLINYRDSLSSDVQIFTIDKHNLEYDIDSKLYSFYTNEINGALSFYQKNQIISSISDVSYRDKEYNIKKRI